MLGWLTCLRMFISRCTRSRSFLFTILSFCRIFMAAYWFVGMCFAFLTLPKVPFPIVFYRVKSWRFLLMLIFFRCALIMRLWVYKSMEVIIFQNMAAVATSMTSSSWTSNLAASSLRVMSNYWVITEFRNVFPFYVEKEGLSGGYIQHFSERGD